MREKRVCDVSTCERLAVTRGWCKPHYDRWLRKGDPEWVDPRPKVCTIDDCDEKHSAGGYCTDHYDRFRRHGDPLWITPVFVMPTEKACTHCGVVKAMDEYTYDRRRITGRQAQCRQCTKDRQRVERIVYPERVAERKRAEYERDREKILTFRVKYRVENRDAILVKAHERYARRTEEDKQKDRDGAAKYRRRNSKVCNERIRQWKQNNPEKVREYTARRRAILWEADHEVIHVDVLGKRDNWMCGICDLPVDPELRFPDRLSRSVDHILPLSMGGQHYYSNVRLAHWYCNVARGAARGEDLDDLLELSMKEEDQ